LTALRAQIDADEEEQSEYDDFDDSDASSHISPQHAVASSQNQCLSSHTSTHSLYASIEPILELTSDIIDSEKNTVTSTPDLEILSQDITDDRIAALEAELAALQAQNSSDEEEQPQYDDFNDFISSTDLVLQKPAASIQNLYILPQSSIPSLSASIKPSLEPALDQNDKQKRASAQFDIPSNFLLRSSIPSTQTPRRPSPTSTASLDSSIASISTQRASPVIQDSVYSSTNSSDINFDHYFDLPLQDSIASMQYSTRSSQASIPSIYTSTVSNLTQRASQTIQTSNCKCTTSSDKDFDDSFDPSLQDLIPSTQTSPTLPPTSSKSLYASTGSLYKPVSNQITSHRVQLRIFSFLPQFSSSHCTFDPVKCHFEFTGITCHTGPPTHAISNFVASLAVSEPSSSSCLEYENIASSKAITMASESNLDPLPLASNFISLASTASYTAFTASTEEFIAPALNRLVLASPLVYIASDFVSSTSTHIAPPSDLIDSTLSFKFLLYFFVLTFLASVFSFWTSLRCYRYHLWPNKRDLRF